MQGMDMENDDDDDDDDDSCVGQSPFTKFTHLHVGRLCEIVRT